MLLGFSTGNVLYDSWTEEKSLADTNPVSLAPATVVSVCSTRRRFNTTTHITSIVQQNTIPPTAIAIVAALGRGDSFCRSCAGGAESLVALARRVSTASIVTDVFVVIMDCDVVCAGRVRTSAIVVVVVVAVVVVVVYTHLLFESQHVPEHLYYVQSSE